jgi:hypothetical protein
MRLEVVLLRDSVQMQERRSRSAPTPASSEKRMAGGTPVADPPCYFIELHRRCFI